MSACASFELLEKFGVANFYEEWHSRDVKTDSMNGEGIIN
jgi:hypothetical protein